MTETADQRVLPPLTAGGCGPHCTSATNSRGKDYDEYHCPCSQCHGKAYAGSPGKRRRGLLMGDPEEQDAGGHGQRGLLLVG